MNNMNKTKKIKTTKYWVEQYNNFDATGEGRQWLEDNGFEIDGRGEDTEIEALTGFNEPNYKKYHNDYDAKEARYSPILERITIKEAQEVREAREAREAEEMKERETEREKATKRIEKEKKQSWEKMENWKKILIKMQNKEISKEDGEILYAQARRESKSYKMMEDIRTEEETNQLIKEEIYERITSADGYYYNAGTARMYTGFEL